MANDVWKRPDVALAYLNERSRKLPDRPASNDVLLRLLRAGRPVRRVLDLGTGDGLLLAVVLDAFPDATGVGVDSSPPMLERARHALGPRAEIVEADLASPTWRSAVAGPFDAVVSGFAIHHLTDERKRELYGEVFALLADGGAFVNAEHVASPTPFVERRHDERMSEHLWRQRDDGSTLEQVLHEYLTRPDRAANLLAPVEEQCRWLREAGFGDVDCFWKLFESAVFGGFRRE